MTVSLSKRRALGLVTLVWLVGSISGGGGAYYLGERSSGEIARDHNALVCVFRSLIIPQRARSVQTADDKTQSDSARKRTRSAIASSDTILRSLITAPRSFDCAKLNH